MTRKKRVQLSDSQRHSVYQMYLSGERARDIASAFDVHESTVYLIIKAEREKSGDAMARREMVVAGNRKYGRLVSTGNDRRYVGTCMVAGKMRSRNFEAPNASDATDQWSDWCNGLRESEEAFMEACEARDAGPVEVEVVDLEDVDVEADAAAHETPAEPACDDVPADEPAEEPVDGPREQDVAYVVWCKSPGPRMYGLYADVDTALAEVERMNEVSRFIGNGSAFEIDEVPWRERAVGVL